MTDGVTSCAECGSPLPPGLPPALCPRCVLADGTASSSSNTGESSSTLPRDFGDYELLEEIARGGMGIVYKARQKSLHRIVALKMIGFKAQAHLELGDRFRAEAIAAGSLSHPHIVPVHEIGEHDDQQFIVMPFVDGQNLARYARKPLSPTRAAEIMATIAGAVHYAHQHGVMHRDLKPSNILIDADGKPHVTDFGLAKALGAAAGELGLEDNLATVALSQIRTEPGQVLGAPAYMPPEQADGRVDLVGRRSDIYSLGATLYHLLTGVPPFEGKSLVHTLHRVVHDAVVPPRRLDAAIPTDIETICLKCLEKDPAARYATAQELGDELRRFLRGEPIRARPISWANRTQRWMRRNPTGAGLIGALVIGVAALTALAKVLYDRSEERAQEIGVIRALVIRNIEELWKRADKTQERISSEQLAILAGKRKSHVSGDVLCLTVGLGATVAPVDRATTYQSTLEFLERTMTASLGREVRLDLVIFKDLRLNERMAAGDIHLARMGALAFIQARKANPSLVPLAQENSPKDAVVFVLKSSGITNLFQVRSIAFADTNSTISAWAKVFLVRTGIFGATLECHANLQSKVEDRDTDYHAHKEALQAVGENRFQAAVGRTHHVTDAFGPEGTNWIALLKFESSQTLWAAGSDLAPEVREALSRALHTLAGLPPRKQEKLKLPDRMRNLVPVDESSLKELEEALDRDLRLFDDGSAAPEETSP